MLKLFIIWGLFLLGNCDYMSTSMEIHIIHPNGSEHGVDPQVAQPGSFGAQLTGSESLMARVVYMTGNYSNGCGPLPEPPYPNTATNRTNWLVVVQREDCTFAEKARNAQKAKYDAILVANTRHSEAVPRMNCEQTYCDEITIYTGAMSLSAWLVLQNYTYDTGYTVKLTTAYAQPWIIWFMLLVAVTAVLFIIVLSFAVCYVYRCIKTFWAKTEVKRMLNRIPIKKFKAGDPWETCIICLDDFEPGDRMRVLPCKHAYHQKCVDPWLLEGKRQCPICKFKLFQPNETSSASTSRQPVAEENTAYSRSVSTETLVVSDSDSSSDHDGAGRCDHDRGASCVERCNNCPRRGRSFTSETETETSSLASAEAGRWSQEDAARSGTDVIVELDEASSSQIAEPDVNEVPAVNTDMKSTNDLVV